MSDEAPTPEEFLLMKRRLNTEAATWRVAARTAERERDALKKELELRVRAGAGVVEPPASNSDATGGGTGGNGEPVEPVSPPTTDGDGDLADRIAYSVLSGLAGLKFAAGRTASEVLPVIASLVEIVGGKPRIEGEEITPDLLAEIVPGEMLAAKSGGGSGGRSPASAGGGRQEDPVTRSYSQREWDKLSPEERKALQRRRVQAAGARVI